MRYAIEKPKLSALEINGSSQLFPIRRILCIGANYVKHQIEMGRDHERETPFFFAKFPDSILTSGEPVPYPPLTRRFHHEIELVVAIGAPAFQIERDQANRVVWGYGVGIDFTRRDLQNEAKQQGRPWECGKSFDRAALASALTPKKVCGALESGRIWLSVNDELRQDADICELIWTVPEIISILSKSSRLEPGDLI